MTPWSLPRCQIRHVVRRIARLKIDSEYTRCVHTHTHTHAHAHAHTHTTVNPRSTHARARNNWWHATRVKPVVMLPHSHPQPKSGPAHGPLGASAECPSSTCKCIPCVTGCVLMRVVRSAQRKAIIAVRCAGLTTPTGLRHVQHARKPHSSFQPERAILPPAPAPTGLSTSAGTP